MHLPLISDRVAPEQFKNRTTSGRGSDSPSIQLPWAKSSPIFYLSPAEFHADFSLSIGYSGGADTRTYRLAPAVGRQSCSLEGRTKLRSCARLSYRRLASQAVC
jgi:hypothetical protein